MLLAMVDDKLYVLSYRDFYRLTFNPDVSYKVFFELKVTGKTYLERKADLASKAMDYFAACVEYTGLSYGELVTLNNFFETNGRRYGMLTEFKENAIC